MANYVLVHGAWGGGWAYDRLAEELETAGHRVLVAELTGLGKLRHALHPGITLTDHIDDVCQQIEAAGFERFVLAGHSYGGMVITGVATWLGARIDAIAYIDAFLPGDGQSLWVVTGDFEHRHYIDSQKFTPGLVAPIMGEENERISKHPLLTLTEAVRYTGEEAKIPRRAYVFAKSWEPTPFRRFAKQVKDDPAWQYHEADCGHDVMAGQPEQLLEIMVGLAR
ncbi:MAG: alpha/beta hydrolase [Sphingomonadaceae bacterium]